MNKLILNKSFFISYFIFLIIGAFILVAYSKTEIFLYINSLHHDKTDFFFRYFTHVGDGIFYGIVIILLLFYKYKYAIIAAASFLVSSVLAQILKRMVFQEHYRPTKYFEGLGIDFHVVEGVKLYSNNSFPSGHATTAFSIFCFLSFIVVDKRLGVLFFIFAFVASYSRIYLGQHFFGDIYFGSLLGVTFTILIFYWLNNFFNSLDKSWPDRSLLIQNQ